MTWESQSAGWLSRSSDGWVVYAEEPRARDTGSLGWIMGRGQQVGSPEELPGLVPGLAPRKPRAGERWAPCGAGSDARFSITDAAKQFAATDRSPSPLVWPFPQGRQLSASSGSWGPGVPGLRPGEA